MGNLLWLILGGSVGTISRYYLARWVETHVSTIFPYGTLAVNLLGCLAIGLLLGVFETRFPSLIEVPLHIRLVLMTGFLGAFTTFSTYEMEAFFYLREGHWEKALLYLGLSIIVGLTLLAGGYHGGRWMAGGFSQV